jgi:hypothetical protein
VKAARRVRREAVRKRPEFTRGETRNLAGRPTLLPQAIGMAADLRILQ